MSLLTINDQHAANRLFKNYYLNLMKLVTVDCRSVSFPIAIVSVVNEALVIVNNC